MTYTRVWLDFVLYDNRRRYVRRLFCTMMKAAKQTVGQAVGVAMERSAGSSSCPCRSHALAGRHGETARALAHAEATRTSSARGVGGAARAGTRARCPERSDVSLAVPPAPRPRTGTPGQADQALRRAPSVLNCEPTHDVPSRSNGFFLTGVAGALPSLSIPPPAARRRQALAAGRRGNLPV